MRRIHGISLAVLHLWSILTSAAMPEKIARLSGQDNIFENTLAAAPFDIDKSTDSLGSTPTAIVDDSLPRDGGRRRNARSSQKLESWLDEGTSVLAAGDTAASRATTYPRFQQMTSVESTALAKGGAAAKSDGKSGAAAPKKKIPTEFKNPCCQICPSQFAANLELMEISPKRKKLIYSRFHKWHKKHYDSKNPVEDELTSFLEKSEGSMTGSLSEVSGQGLPSVSPLDTLSRFSVSSAVARKGGSSGGKSSGKAPAPAPPPAAPKAPAIKLPPIHVPLVPGQEPCCALCPGGFDEVARLSTMGAKAGIMLELGAVATSAPIRRHATRRTLPAPDPHHTSARLKKGYYPGSDAAWRRLDALADPPRASSLLEEGAAVAAAKSGGSSKSGAPKDFCCKICAHQFYAPREFFDYETINSGESVLLETRSRERSAASADVAASAGHQAAAKVTSHSGKGGAAAAKGGDKTPPQQCCVACKKNMYSNVEDSNPPPGAKKPAAAAGGKGGADKGGGSSKGGPPADASNPMFKTPPRNPDNLRNYAGKAGGK